MVKHFVVVWVAIVGLVGSASAQELVKLRFRIEPGQKFTYSMTSTTEIESPSMEGAAETDMMSSFTMSGILDIVCLEKSATKQKLAIESRNMTIDMGQLNSMPVENLNIIQTTNLRGKILAIESKDKAITESTKTGLTFEYPEEAVGLGSEWTVDSQAVPEANIPAMRTTYQIIERLRWNGYDAFLFKIFTDPSVDNGLTHEGTVLIDIKTGMTLKLDSKTEMTWDGTTAILYSQMTLMK